jgi:hypothetical protein
MEFSSASLQGGGTRPSRGSSGNWKDAPWTKEGDAPEKKEVEEAGKVVDKAFLLVKMNERLQSASNAKDFLDKLLQDLKLTSQKAEIMKKIIKTGGYKDEDEFLKALQKDFEKQTK